MLAAAMMSVLLVVTGGAAVVGSAVIGRHRAQAVADLGALAAANRLASGPGSACDWAAAVASASRATVAGCVVDGLDVVVTVQVGVRLGRWGVGLASASARAGPA
ncbi:hypothetical protein MMAD_49440 [Mycolicibacterium madagascariense]|uniref:Putative Flp pilus-assembly TadG-like N-terminal domain-containing protein n=1 Tax=Mycolicibacterium madagascariense TaxID=212765 RepID=A0A7I7XN59_9MYCO|nr:hypothetical protein MMAD_49440 [Mycolicibacterium madagascariense]